MAKAHSPLPMGCSNSNCVRGGREEVKFEEGKQSAELTDEEINERMEMVSIGDSCSELRGACISRPVVVRE